MICRSNKSVDHMSKEGGTLEQLEAGLRAHVHAAIRAIKKAEEDALNLSAKDKMEMLQRLIGIEEELTELLNVYNGDGSGDA